MILALINEVVSNAVSLLLSVAGLEKAAIKAVLTEWHLIYLWDSARELLGVPFVFGTVAALLLERTVGLVRSKSLSASFWQGVWFRVLNVFVLSVALASTLRLIHYCYDTYLPFLQVRVLDGVPILAQFFGVLIVGDFARYAHHWIRHKVPVFWAFHAVHHSEPEINPATEFRGHIGDRIHGALINAGPTMLLGGDPRVIAAIVFCGEFWNLWLHCDSRITLGQLGKVINNPAFHKIHHSRERRHWDKNFGNYFCIWDRMCGTAYMGLHEEFATGINGYGRAEPTSNSIPGYIANWGWLTIRPFLDIARGGWRSRSGGWAREPLKVDRKGAL